MIKPVFFKGNISNTFKSANHIEQMQIKPDSFEPSDELKLERAKAAARESISDAIKENGIERCVILLPNGEVFSTTDGNSDSVGIKDGCIPKDCIMLHGHPSSYVPLSTRDVRTLLVSPAKSEEAVMYNGDYSRLVKNSNFNHMNREFCSPEDLDLNLEASLYEMVFDKMGIDYDFKPQDIVDIYRDVKQNIEYRDMTSKTDEDIISELKMYGVDVNSPDAINQLKNILMYTLLLRSINFDTKYGRNQKIYKVAFGEKEQQIRDFLATDEGLAVRQDFLKQVAEKYNLTYETNMKNASDL